MNNGKLTVVMMMALWLGMGDMVYAMDPTAAIAAIIDKLKIPVRLVAGILAAFRGFKWFESPEEGKKALLASIMGIATIWLFFEGIAEWLTD